MSSIVIHQFPTIEEPHIATIKNKSRNSGLTSANFIGLDRVLCADFNEKRMYLASISDGNLEIISSVPTVITDGTAVQTDLMDFQDGRIIDSKFYQGSVEIYRLEGDKIEFEGEINENNFKGLNGVRFIPNHPSLLWLTYCGNKKKCHQIADIETKKLIHQIDTEQQCQDVAFIDGSAAVFARTDHIKVGAKATYLFSRKWWMFATAYVYKIPENLRETEPEFVSRWKGKGHIDACKAYKGEVFAANQYLDRVDIFKLSAKGKLSLSRTIKGMGMPHGLDLHDNKHAVTNYGDQTLRVMDLS